MLISENVFKKNESSEPVNTNENPKNTSEIVPSEEKIESSAQEIILSEENNKVTSDLSRSSDIKLEFSLARDDLFPIKNLYISTKLMDCAIELVYELYKLAEHYGFNLTIVPDGYFWLEDNMWLSSDGREAFQPQKAWSGDSNYLNFINAIDNQDIPGKEEEGYHSLSSPMFIQGISQPMLDLADNLTRQYNVTMKKTLSIIDGGNMLTGSRADGTRYVLLGRDALLQTTLRQSTLDKERIALRIEKIQQYNEEMRRDYHIAYQNIYEIDILLLEAAGFITADMDNEARQNFAQFTRVKAQIAREHNILSNTDSRPMNLSPGQRAALETHYRTLYGILPDNFDNLLLENYNKLVAAHEISSVYSEELIKEKLNSGQPDVHAIARMTLMLQAGQFIRKSLDAGEAEKQAIRFLTMIEISKNIMAAELNIEPDNLIFVSQADFHIDMFLRPLSEGRILLNDYAECIQLIENVLNDESNLLAEKDRRDLQQTLDDLEPLHEKRQSTTAFITQQLENAGLTVIKVPGVFSAGNRKINYMNGIMGIGLRQHDPNSQDNEGSEETHNNQGNESSQSEQNSQNFYITNASSITALNHAFAAYLQKKQPNLNVHFVGSSRSHTDAKLNQAESLLAEFGALDCFTLHHGENSHDKQPDKGSQNTGQDSDNNNVAALSHAMSSMPGQQAPSAILPPFTAEETSASLIRVSINNMNKVYA